MVDNIGVFIIKGKNRRVYKKDDFYFYYNSRFKRIHIDESQLKNDENGTKRSL